MQYTVRTSIEGRDERLDEMCRMFCSMEGTGYSLLREGVVACSKVRFVPMVKFLLS